MILRLGSATAGVVVGWVTPGVADDGDGREKPHILVPGLAGAGSKVRELGLLDGAPARPRRAKATRATGTWGGMWGGQRRIRLQR